MLLGLWLGGGMMKKILLSIDTGAPRALYIRSLALELA